MDDIVVILLLLPFHYLVPWWIVRFDMRRLPPERLARCWNSASLGSAILAFGPLCLPFHFVKAHGFLLGSLLGIVAALLVVWVPAAAIGFLEALITAR